MIKRSTVIKRMISKNWKVATTALLTVTAMVVASAIIGRYLDVDPNFVYWTLLFILFIGVSIKWSYDWNKTAIEMEQKQMLRDIEKKHL